ncbi:MAG: FAD-dependent oxidoreductase [Gemmatimonadales bacterium]
MKRTIVVGGGVIGVCCAYFLARRGSRVAVLERDEIGSGASFGNAGTISPGHPPMNRPVPLRKAVRWLLDPVSPLYIPARWDPDLARWLKAFRSNSTQERLEANMDVLAPLGHASRPLFDRLVEEEALDCDYRPDGYYEIFRTEHGREEVEAEAAMARASGFRTEFLPPEALHEREPALKRGLLGGAFYPEAATCNPLRFVQELAGRIRRHGGEVVTGVEVVEVLARNGRVTGVRTREGEVWEGDRVVLATGAYSLDLVTRFGCRLPVQAGKGYHRDGDPASGAVPPLNIACILREYYVLCAPMDGFVRLAGTMEFSGLNHEIREARVAQLTKAAGSFFDGVGGVECTSEWCGLRPCTPYGLPIVGPLSAPEGVFVATGHAMLGLTLGPVTGQLVAEWILDGKPSIDIDAMRVERF